MLRCYFKALDFNRQILSSDHIEIANIFSLIRFGYEQMKNSSEAFRYYNESLSIYQIKYESEHKDVTRVEANIIRLNNS